MMRKVFSLNVSILAVMSFATIASAQDVVFNLDIPNGTPPDASQLQFSILSASGLPYHGLTADQTASLAASGTGYLQTFTITGTAAQNGGSYSTTMVGRNPFLRGKLPTHTKVPVFPLVLTFNSDPGTTFDPRVPSANNCTAGHTVTELLQNSPLFTPYPFTSNGVNVGPAQYIDAFQRSEFWSLINGANYHTIMDLSYPAAIGITIGTSVGFTQNIGCTGKVGFIEINAYENFIQTVLIPYVKTNYGVDATQFPMFLQSNVYWYINTPSVCCVLGYHNAIGAGPIQTYSPTAWDSSGIFGAVAQDGAVATHEIGEWANDPYVNNPTPAWGHIGQVGGCQGNLEVGDPLTGTQFPPLVGVNGYTYHMQELAFYNWFIGGPSLGTGGKYSNNGTFKGFAKLCPPGGTN